MDMGFEERRVDWALHAAKGGGLQAATDHLVENSERPVPDFEQEAQEEDAAVAAAQGGEAKSMKCLDCGKVMRNTALASFHAEKSGHTNFEESTEELKPLTEEEKKERLEESALREGEGGAELFLWLQGLFVLLNNLSPTSLLNSAQALGREAISTKQGGCTDTKR